MSTVKYDVGVIGCGNIAVDFHIPIVSYLDRTSLEYVADIDESRAERVGRAFDATAVGVDEPTDLPAADILVLAIPVGVRQPYVEEFGDRDTALLVEKPFAFDESEHRTLLEFAGPVCCNYMRREFASTRLLRRVLECRPFGPLENVVLLQGKPQQATGQSAAQTDPQTRGGQLHEHGVHALSQLTYIFEDHELTVEAADVVFNRGIDIDIDATFLATRDGTSIEISYDQSIVRQLGWEARFTFENATVSFDPSQPSATPAVYPAGHEDDEPLSFLTLPDSAPKTGLAAMLRRWRTFLDGLNDGTLDQAVQTDVATTKLVTEIFDHAGGWPGDGER